MKTYILKVKKVKRTETDGKADTHSVILEGSTAPGIDFSLTIASEDQAELKKIVSIVPGVNVEMSLAPALYGNIESYGPAAGIGFSGKEAAETLQDNLQTAPKIDKSYMDPKEAAEIRAFLDPYKGTENAGKDPRETTQAAALQARREAWQASQGSPEAEQ